jgi:hypothetical protein
MVAYSLSRGKEGAGMPLTWISPVRMNLASTALITRRDDGVVPLICPTCQMVSQDAQHDGSRRLLCMGLFSVFLLSGHGSFRPNSLSCSGA